MARDRLMSLRQVQRILASGSPNFQYIDSRPNSRAPSLSAESIVIDEDEDEQADSSKGLKAFFAKVETIQALLQELKEDVELVKRKQSEIIGSPSTNDPLRKELDELMSQIKGNTKQIRGSLKEIELEIAKEAQSGQPEIYFGAAHRIKKVQHSTLLGDFTECINTYLSSQGDFQDRCKDKIRRQVAIAGRSSVSYQDDEAIEKIMDDPDHWNIFTREIISEPTVTKQMLDDIEARHDDILKLEKSIVDLHDIFVEMSILVECQGAQIDSIENHVNESREYVESAKTNIVRAKEFQKSARKKKIIIYGILAVVVVVVIIIILALVI